MNLVPMVPVEGTPLEDAGEPTWVATFQARQAAAKHLNQISHCRRCRADAAGTLDGGLAPERIAGLLEQASATDRTRVAVASREGVLVNLHLGEAGRFLVYELDDGVPALIDERSAPEPGGGAERWKRLSDVLSDCGFIVVSGIGDAPRRALERAGVTPVVVSGTVAEITRLLLKGDDYSHLAVAGFRCSGGGAQAGCA
jgi:nitrogen fixation protein NifB